MSVRRHRTISQLQHTDAAPNRELSACRLAPNKHATRSTRRHHQGPGAGARVPLQAGRAPLCGGGRDHISCRRSRVGEFHCVAPGLFSLSVCLCIPLSLFRSLSFLVSLSLLFSRVLCRSRIACVLDVCALALAALVAPSLHLFLVDSLGTPTPLHLTPRVELIHCGRFLCRCRGCHGNAGHVHGANGRLAMRLWADAIADAEA